MTEAEWLASTDPRAMLPFLSEGGALTDRKARLAAAACCRRIWALLDDERSRRAVEVAELYADGLVSRLRRSGAEAEATRAAGAGGSGRPWFAAQAAKMTVSSRVHLPQVMNFTPVDNTLRPGEMEARRVAQAHLLRDLFSPFRTPALDPAWLAANDHAVRRLAEAAHDHRDLPSGELDPARLAVLSDALEEAGCCDDDLLSHLRSPGPHALGCWAVDRLMGRS